MNNHGNTEARNSIKLELEELTGKIIACAIEVHKALGPGFLESIYQAALPVELESSGLNVEEQKEVKIFYHGKEIGTHRLDLVVENQVIVELKAVKEFSDAHTAQVLSYLKATGMKIGLLLNFAKPTIQVKRVVR
jgi:GxxExxY protein